MKKINFVVAAFNEEARIVQVVSSIAPFADQIVVLDPGSTDNTISLAQEAFPVAVVSVPVDMFAIRKRYELAFNVIRTKSSSEWFVGMNCSEIFTNELGYELLALINGDDKLVAVDFYRQSYTFGIKTHNRKLYYTLKHIFKLNANFRLLKISAWDCARSRMHAEFPVIPSLKRRTTWLVPFGNRSLVHYRQGYLLDFEKKHSLYSTNEARERYARGEKSSLFKMFFVPLLLLFYFFPSVFYNRTAFIVALYHVFYKFQVQAKLHMLTRLDKPNEGKNEINSEN